MGVAVGGRNGADVGVGLAVGVAAGGGVAVGGMGAGAMERLPEVLETGL